MLSRERVDEYEKNGYTIVSGILGDRDLEPVRRVISAQVDREARKLKEEGKITDIRGEAPFERRLYEIHSNPRQVDSWPAWQEKRRQAMAAAG